MAKVSLNEITPIKSVDPVTVMIGENEITIEQYLPINEKLAFTERVLNATLDDTGFLNPVRLEVYMNPDKYSIHEAACYNPKTELLTLTVNGEKITKTWQEWSASLTASGEYANADMQTKLSILSDLEKNFLSRYYRIPLLSTTVCSLLSYQTENYTDNYNIMYGFGGIRLMKYNYDDAQWSAFVRSVGYRLDY